MLTIRWSGVKELVRDLRVARERALPYAVRNALNTAAFEARRMWQVEIQQSFVQRSPFTQRSVLVERAKGTDLRRMHAVVGSTAPYMGKQEEGGVVRGRGKHKPIPGPAAAGQRPGAHRTRLVRPNAKLSAIKAARVKGTTVQQRWAVTIAMARRKGQRDVLLERPNGGKGLFRLGGGKRGRAKLKLLWDVSKGSVRVKPEPTLQRTLKRLEPKLPHMYAAAIVEQFERLRLLGH